MRILALALLFVGCGSVMAATPNKACLDIWSELKVKIQLFQQLAGTVEQLGQSLEDTYSLWGRKITELKSPEDVRRASQFLENSARGAGQARQQNKTVLDSLAQETDELSSRLENCLAGREEQIFYPQSVIFYNASAEGVQLLVHGAAAQCSSYNLVQELGEVEGDRQVVILKLVMENCNHNLGLASLQKVINVKPGLGVKILRFFAQADKSLFSDIVIDPKN